MDLAASIGTLFAGSVMGTVILIPWLQRKGVVRASNRAEENAISTLNDALTAQKELTSEQHDIAEGWRVQSEVYRAARIELERRLDEAYAQQRVEREATYKGFQADRVADRLQIESLSKKVHELTLSVSTLTSENEKLRAEVHQLSAKVDTNYANKSNT